MSARLVVVGALAVVVAAVTDAKGDMDISSANYMLPGCRAYAAAVNSSGKISIDTFGAGNCAGRIQGLMALRDDLVPTARFCMPPTVTTAQAVQMVLAWLEANPSRWHENFMALADGVFRRAWPCR